MTAKDEINRFVDFYASELSRTGFRPDADSTRNTRIDFLQQTLKRFCSPLLAMKRADPTRPISDEVVVYLEAGPGYRVFSDFLLRGGSDEWQLSYHLEGVLPTSQPLVNPLTLAQLPEGVLAPTVPGCTGPTPEPEPPPVPVYPPYPGDSAFDPLGVVLFADYAEAGQPPNWRMSCWYGRTIYDWLTGVCPTIEASIAKHRNGPDGWRQALGLPT